VGAEAGPAGPGQRGGVVEHVDPRAEVAEGVGPGGGGGPGRRGARAQEGDDDGQGGDGAGETAQDSSPCRPDDSGATARGRPRRAGFGHGDSSPSIVSHASTTASSWSSWLGR